MFVVARLAHAFEAACTQQSLQRPSSSKTPSPESRVTWDSWAVGIILYSLPSAWLHSVNCKTPGSSKAHRVLMPLTRSLYVPHSLRNSPPSKESILTIRTRNLFTSVVSAVVNSLVSQWMITMTCQIRTSHGVIERAFVLASEDCQSWLCHILAMLP